MRVHLDFESRSTIDLKTQGLDVYARHPSTQVLMLGYAFDNEDVQLWQPHLQPQMPTPLKWALEDDRYQKIAWNSTFERAIFLHVLGIDIPIPKWLDPSVMARYASIGGSLMDVTTFLGFEADKAKDKAGKALISRFCKPTKTGEFNDWSTHPEEWEQFGSYCRQDVVAEREVLHKIEGWFSLTDIERRVWELDQEINERGIPIDRLYVENARRIVTTEHDRLVAELTALTGCDNPNSPMQLLAWLKTQGYPYGSLGAAKIRKALEEANAAS